MVIHDNKGYYYAKAGYEGEKIEVGEPDYQDLGQLTAMTMTGDVYLVIEAEKNGETRNFVEKADVAVGEQVEDGYLVLDGIGEWDFVVTETDKELKDGMEVFLPE